MKVRPVNEEGDMIPVQYESQMVKDASAVAQVVKERLSFYRGEWWEDRTIGIRLPEFLADNVRRSDVDILGKYITSYVAETEGVTGVGSVSVSYEKRVLYYRCVIQTDFGSEVVEVDLNGLL